MFVIGIDMTLGILSPVILCLNIAGLRMADLKIGAVTGTRGLGLMCAVLEGPSDVSKVL